MSLCHTLLFTCHSLSRSMWIFSLPLFLSHCFLSHILFHSFPSIFPMFLPVGKTPVADSHLVLRTPQMTTRRTSMEVSLVVHHVLTCHSLCIHLSFTKYSLVVHYVFTCRQVQVWSQRQYRPKNYARRRICRSPLAPTLRAFTQALAVQAQQ